VNILVLYQSPWWNAAAYYSYNLIKSLINNEHRVVFAGKADSPLALKLNEFGIELHDIDLFVNSPFRFIKNITTVKKIIKVEKIDHLVPVSAPGHIILGILKKFYKVKLPVIKVCLDNIPPRNNVFNRYLHNKLTDFFIFPGRSTKDRYKTAFVINKFQILHPPLEFKEFINYLPEENTKRTIGIPEDKILVSFIGRFSPEKGIFFLLDIIKATLKKSDKIFFLLSGSEEQIKHDEVKQKIKEHELENNVKIIDKADDVRKLINIADLGILTSRYSEFICRIAMEFMAFKKPVVAPNLNVIPEVVEHRKSGFIYELEDADMAAEFVVKLANNTKLINEMGENGFKRISEHYSMEVFSEEVEKILEQVQ